MNNIFSDISLIIIVATVFGFLVKLIKQPLIPAYIITGIFIGPVLGLITNLDIITTLSEIGIAFLLFIVGLEINLTKLKNVGLVSSLGGFIRAIILFTFGFAIAIMFNFKEIEAVYIGLIISFSSTMVVGKLLSEKRELDTLHGRIVLGMLLLEDFIAILALSILTTLNDFSSTALFLSLLKGITIVAIAIIGSKYIFPNLFKFAAKSQELLFLLSLSICFLFVMLFYYIGFSIVIGAFIAGVTLANLPYNLEIIGKVKSLRDFFATIFFVSLGMGLITTSFKSIIGLLILMILFILIFKPIITMFICSFFGYKKRTGFLTAISLAQISEFSLIIVMQGISLGHISNEILTLTVLVAIITMIFTSYFINYDQKIYTKVSTILNIFDRFTTEEAGLEYLPKKKKFDIILCGHNRLGYSISRKIRKMKKNLLVVDYNPEIIRHLIREKIPCIYGDIGNLEILERLNLKNAKMVISTVPDIMDNLLLIKKTREKNKNAVIMVTANQVEEALTLYDAGADYVILPHFLGGEHVSLLIEEFTTGDVNKIIETKLNHIKELQERRKIGHEHPKYH